MAPIGKTSTYDWGISWKTYRRTYPGDYKGADVVPIGENILEIIGESVGELIEEPILEINGEIMWYLLENLS